MIRNILVAILTINSVVANAQVSSKIQIGSARTATDVDATVDPLNAAQISVYYDLNDRIALYGGLSLKAVNGADESSWSTAADGGGLVESYYMPDSAYRWNPSFSSKLLTLSTGAVFKQDIIKNRLRLLVGGAFGISNASAYVDLLDSEGEHYNTSGRITLSLAELDMLYDGSYETRVEDLDSWLINLQFTAGLELSLNESLSLCIDYTRYVLPTDYLDGIKFRTATEETGSNDGVNFISLGLKMKFLDYEENKKYKEEE